MTAAPSRRAPSQARSAATVASILRASRDLLQQGEELTARSIAVRAGIAAPTVYRYFADTDAVVDALLLEHAAAAETMVDEVLADDPGDHVGCAFQRVIDGYLALYASRPELTVTWASAVMAERQRLIEQVSDTGLAERLADHLVAGGAVDHRARAAFTRRVTTYWHMAGVALGAVLQAEDRRRRAEALSDLRAFVDHAAERCA